MCIFYDRDTISYTEIHENYRQSDTKRTVLDEKDVHIGGKGLRMQVLRSGGMSASSNEQELVWGPRRGVGPGPVCP